MLPSLRSPVELFGSSDAGRRPAKGDNASSAELEGSAGVAVTAEETVAGPSGSEKGATTASSRRSLCPVDFQADREMAERGMPVWGVSRVTRHPALWSLALLGLGCALRTPFVAEACFFGGPLLVVAVLGAHKDYRFRRGIGGEMLTDWPTSCHVPFATVVAGHQSLSEIASELRTTNAAVAVMLALAVALRRLKHV